MDNEISKLILYSDIGVDSIISRLGSIYHDWKTGHDSGISLTNRIYKQIKRLLDLSTEFGFDNNLWHNYLTFILMTNENSFSLTCERAGAGNGSVNSLAKNDFRVFKSLFDFDFSPMEKDLGIDCCTTITD